MPIIQVKADELQKGDQIAGKLTVIWTKWKFGEIRVCYRDNDDGLEGIRCFHPAETMNVIRD